MVKKLLSMAPEGSVADRIFTRFRQLAAASGNFSYMSQMQYHTFQPEDASAVLQQEPALDLIATALVRGDNPRSMLLPGEPLSPAMRDYGENISAYRRERQGEGNYVPLILVMNIDYSLDQQEYRCAGLAEMVQRSRPDIVVMSSLSPMPIVLRSLIQDVWLRLFSYPRAYEQQPRVFLRKSERQPDNGIAKSMFHPLAERGGSRFSSTLLTLSLDDFLTRGIDKK